MPFYGYEKGRFLANGKCRSLWCEVWIATTQQIALLLLLTLLTVPLLALSVRSKFPLDTVDKALKEVKKILDTSKNPRIVDADVEHTYNDKFLWAESITNTSLVALRSSLTSLGVTEEHWAQWEAWTKDHKAVTIRFQAAETCELEKHEIVEVDAPSSVETTTTSSALGGFRKTTSTKVKLKYGEDHWKVSVKYSLVAFAGNATEQAVTITSRDATEIIRTKRGSSDTNPRPPISKRTDHRPIDWDITWLLKQLYITQEGSGEGQFAIERESAKTPRNNEAIRMAEKFQNDTAAQMNHIAQFFWRRLDEQILGQDKPVVAPNGPVPRVLSHLKKDSVFYPTQPFLEDGTTMSASEIESVLEGHDKELGTLLSSLSESFESKQTPKLVTLAEASLMTVCVHIQGLALSYIDCMGYLESVVEKQLVKAIGKKVTADDFSSFMKYHNRRLLAPSYAPAPFSYSVRRPGHAPDGILSIESTDGTPIDSVVRHVGTSEQSAPLQIPLSAATTISMTGDWYLHGWMMHQFANQSYNFSLAARARQFSSFMLIIGNMAGAHKLEPKHAIILQNKDDLLIPLLTEVLPSAKDFKDAISSLSPEQQAFCKAFRAMQLESSVFGVAVIQLKPQIEKLLGLIPGSLTKEIQLTQDLMTLFIEYQIPSDLLSFDGPNDASKADRLTAVKQHVKAVMDVISAEKEKTILAEEQKADYREAQAAPLRPEEFDSFGASLSDFQYKEQSGTLNVAKKKYNAFAKHGRPPNRRSAPQPAMAMSAVAFSSPPPPVAPSAETTSLDASIAPDALPMQVVATDLPSIEATTSKEDFTMLPKELDSKLEVFDTDNALHSTIIKAGPSWKLQRQENLLASSKPLHLDQDKIGSEKKKAFDLLDAISCSGSLPIEAAELHVVVALSHCFEKNLMMTVIEDNINPIAKAEKTTLLLASTVHGVNPGMLLASSQDTNRLETAFPKLFEG